MPWPTPSPGHGRGIGDRLGAPPAAPAPARCLLCALLAFAGLQRAALAIGGATGGGGPVLVDIDQFHGAKVGTVQPIPSDTPSRHPN
jgi:hypothetical protein